MSPQAAFCLQIYNEQVRVLTGKSESAMNTFKSMDAASPAGRGRGGKVAIQRSPSAIKDMLLAWVKQQVDGYPVSQLARILVQVTIYRRLLIGRDGHLDQSEAYDIS